MLSSDDLRNIQLVCFDFDGVFTDNSVYVDQLGIESVKCLRSDGIGIERLNSIGIKTYIISTESNPVVKARALKLKIPFMQDVSKKDDALITVCNELKIELNNTMFVGNDVNDIDALDLVKYPVGVADSFCEIDNHILFKTKASGGHGAVREICDMIYKAQN